MLDFPNNPEFKFSFLIRGIETFTLDQAPDGWNKTLIEFATSKSFVALQRSLSQTYTFIGNAAMLCRRETAVYGVMANIIFTIDYRQDDLSYRTIFKGKLNFADPESGDVQKGFLVPAINADFTLNIDAYGGVNYEIDISDGISVQLPALILNESASIILQGNTDKRSLAFFALSITNNTQNSVNRSVYDYGGQFAQVTNPDWATDGHFFFQAQTNCNVLFDKVSIQGVILQNNVGPAIYSIQIWKSDGTLVKTIYTSGLTSGNFNVTQSFTIPVLKGERLFLYFNSSNPDSNFGFRIDSGVLNISYLTTSPPTMARAISGSQLLSRLLTEMNPNNNGVPNSSVPYQSFLLAMGVLQPVYFTCADSIRSGNGSFYSPGTTIGQGIYQVLQGTINYGGLVVSAPNTFSFDASTLTFAQVGSTPAYVQKIQSIFVGNVYDTGQSLEQGGTFLVEAGLVGGGGIIYNGKFISVGQYFDYVLGQDTYTQSDVDGDNYVKQVAEAPKIITNLNDFFQCVKSLMFGDACLGVNPSTGVVFIETLGTAFQGAAPVNADLGNASEQWKRPPATDMMFANFKAGYADQEYTTENGYQEVNSQQEYSSAAMLATTSAPVNTYPNELNLVNPYRADPLGYEEMRISQNDTAASRSSNDVCMLWLNLAPVVEAGYTYYNPVVKADVTDLYGVVEGYYNFMLSPKSCLLRGMNYLASIFYNLTSYPITLASALKNSGMVYVYNGVRVAEADEVIIPASVVPYFIPYYLTDTIGLRTEILAQMDINPYAPVRITVNNIVIYGFAIDFKVNQARGDNESVKLLLTTKNNLLDFVR